MDDMAFHLLVAIVALPLLVASDTVSNGHPSTTIQDFTPGTSAAEPNLCLTSDCIKAAEWIVSSLNTSADPCYDMAEFACGGWIKNHSEEISDSIHKFDSYSLAKKNLEKMIEIIALSPENSNSSTAHKILRGYFSSCMDEKRSSEMRSATIEKMIGDLSMTNATSELSSTALTELLDRVLRLNTAPLFGLDFSIANYNRSTPSRDFPHRLGIIMPSAKWLLIEETQAIIQPSSGNLMETMKSLYDSVNSMFDSNREILSVKQLQQRFGFVNWLPLFTGLYGSSISDATEVAVDNPKYLEVLQKIILETLDQRDIYTAVAIKAMGELLDGEMTAGMTANGEELERKAFCMAMTTRELSRVLSSIYVQQLTPAQLNDVRIKSKEMVSTLKRSIASIINKSSWMDTFSRRNALEKLDQLRVVLGAPEKYFDSTYMEQMMSSIDIDGLDFLAATWQIRKFNHKLNCDVYATPANINALLMLKSPKSLPTFNPHDSRGALYSPQFNSIFISLGKMIESWFLLDAPNYLSLGSLGHPIAHEMQHAILTERLMADLFSNENMRIYLEKRDCLIEQFTDVFKMDGEYSIEENVADLGGLNAIIEAFHLLQANTTIIDQSLPGLSQYTSEQLMLLRVSQMNCAVESTDSDNAQYFKSPHTSYPDRINGMMMNLPEFGRIFGCPVGSRMNPEKKCSIW